MLITPHGDRKRQGRRREVLDARDLITPHGDRKPWPRDPSCAHRSPVLITPHGDRKPVWPGAVGSTALPSHYPSWGSKTRRGGETRRCPLWRSLPLMGIENDAVGTAGPTAEAGDLITPHGDRKLCDEVCRRHRRRHGHLITPHGDRKPPTFRRSSSYRNCLSLPLMGIENASLLFVGAGTAVCSLPLMGIENLAGQAGRVDHVPERGLITPHGDRKLVGHRSHYPSAYDARCSARRLITPHGDRKLVVSLVDVGRHGASLPLMGIENIARWARRSDNSFSLPLMGIENAELLGEQDARGASLPLMGIENKIPPLWGPVQEALSLPLMGIENPSAVCSDKMMARVSLPLMGIENLRRWPRTAASGPPLITPHGDRKPARPRQDQHFLRQQLITPHGDRKLAVSRSNRRSHSTSLPLMGIENAGPRTPMPPSRLVTLITPHGDRKPTPPEPPDEPPEPPLITPHGDRKPLS